MLDIMAFEWTCSTSPKDPSGVKESIEVYINDKSEAGQEELVDRIKEVAVLLKEGIGARDVDKMMRFHAKYTLLLEALKPKEE